jgi:hypothetical protein
MSSYNLFTAFPQKLLKTLHRASFPLLFLALLLPPLVTSCTYFKSDKGKLTGKEDQTTLQSALIDMSEDDIRKRFGEPTMVSKTPENHILWTYRPEWKIMPDNAGTIYIEFVEGKVIKVLKVR